MDNAKTTNRSAFVVPTSMALQPGAGKSACATRLC